MPFPEHWSNRSVTLPGRGEIFIREFAGAPGAPALILLHGLGATGLLNWRTALDDLATRYRVVVVDHRGHGRGMPIRARFRLADCADDVAVLTEVLGIERFFAAGYSMGGPIAQLLWHRHPERVAGLVFCATACRFSSAERRRLGFLASPSLGALGRIAPRNAIRRMVFDWIADQIDDPEARQRVLSEVESSDPVAISQAAAAILRFDARDWVGEIDVPTSVVLTELDRMVRPQAQQSLADRLENVRVYRIAADHMACRTAPKLFVPALMEACESVVSRAA
jgi:pimeloyl-ACP methyl ester carboxylesterase